MRILAVATLVAAIVSAPAVALAQNAPERTLLSITANGQSEARPDFGTLTLGVTATAPTVPAALGENSRRMDGLLQALRGAGVAERDIQTAQVSLNPRHRYSNDDREHQLIGYEATNTVRVLVRRVSDAGRIATAAVEAGGNTIQGASFSLDDPTAQLDTARRNASAEARRRADVYAASFGLRVVRVVSITEPGAAIVTIGQEEMVATGSRQNVPVRAASISPGMVTTRATLNVTFELR